jgi:hypothetical protein
MIFSVFHTPQERKVAKEALLTTGAIAVVATGVWVLYRKNHPPKEIVTGRCVKCDKQLPPDTVWCRVCAIEDAINRMFQDQHNCL